MHLTSQREGTLYDCCTLPIPDIQWLLRNHSFSANSLTGFPGQIGNHYPKDKFLVSILLLRWIPPHLFSPSTIPLAPMAFTHGDSNKESHKEYMKETMTLCPIFFPPRKIMPNLRICMPSS